VNVISVSGCIKNAIVKVGTSIDLTYLPCFAVTTSTCSCWSGYMRAYRPLADYFS